MNQPIDVIKSKSRFGKNSDSCFSHLAPFGWLILFVAALHLLIEFMLMRMVLTGSATHPLAKAFLDTALLVGVLFAGLFFFNYLPSNRFLAKDDNRSPTSGELLRPLVTNSLQGNKVSDELNWLLSPKRLVPLMGISIFISEIGIMLMLSSVPSLPPVYEAFLDATGLLIILSPTFYFFHYRPIHRHYQERKIITDKLKGSEERLQLALHAVSDSLWDCDLVSGTVYVSPRAETMLGYSPGEIEPTITAWRELLHPEDKDDVIAAQKEHIAGLSSHYMIEHRMRSKNGNWVWVHARGQVVSWDGNKPVRMVGTHTDITQRKKAEHALRQSEEEIRTLSHKLMHAAEKEKKHLAQDLHDEFGQVLTTFQLGVEMLQNRRCESETDHWNQCERLLKLIRRMEVDLRHVCDQLRPVMLDDLGLVETLRWHMKEFAQINRAIHFDFKVAGNRQLPRDFEIALYRIYQEGVNNIAKHARASNFSIELNIKEKIISLSLADDGQGFDNDFLINQKRNPSGLGLLGMRERAAALGGKLTVESETGRGTRIIVELPLTDQETAADVNQDHHR